MEHFLLFAKGVWIGGTLTIPGVSGGTMAMVLGIYERLISAVNGLIFGKERWRSACFLGTFTAGGGVGLLLFSGFVRKLLTAYPTEMVFFFIGAVMGGVPVIAKELRKSVFHWSQLLYFFVGVLSVILISSIPEGAGLRIADGDIIMRFLGGTVAAIALVLPGISVSHVLYVLGIYESLMESISRFELLKLFPFGIGLLIATVLSTKWIGTLLEHYRTESHLAILGFSIGSVFEMVAKVPLSSMTIFCPLVLMLGTTVVLGISKKADA